ncbi:MAG TPA: hydroxysqualene dehydroxylase HpnE [Solirubrobacteraceae bacterium]|nr:hydroxysqualene dehydroxylase HpnE [Solirubrobacteraceae bacterium]
MSGRSVTVVGGGLAGITAALECARSGASVTVLESRGRLGGAAYSFTRNGIHADNGQHVFLRCCTAYRGLLEELGATDAVVLQPRLEMTVLAPGGRRAVLRGSRLPAPLHLAGALLRYPFLTLRERISVARTMQRLRTVDAGDPGADARSFGDWLREHGQSPAALETIWSLIARPTLNLELDAASLAQAAQVFQLGLLADRSAGDIGFARVPLSEIHDVAARRALGQAGVDVRLRRGATMIVPTDTGFRIEVSGAPTVESHAVILAVSPDRAARLAGGKGGIDERISTTLGRSPIVNLHVVYDRRVLDVPFAAGVHTPVQWMFDRTRSAGLSSGQYLAISLSAADEELGVPAGELQARYLPALRDLLPAARDAAIEEFFVTREHAATFRAAPGARACRPGPRTHLPGLLLAGCWTDTGWPATMEGAVRSGRAAAREALNELFRPARPQPLPGRGGGPHGDPLPQGELAGGRA